MQFKEKYQKLTIVLFFSTIDPVSLFERSLPECKKCIESNKLVFEKFRHNECHCSLGLGTTTSIKKSSNTNKGHNPFFGRTISSESSNGEGNLNDGTVFKPKFGRKRHADQNMNPNSLRIPEIDIDLTKEDEDKVHKSNVAKITFKTAKEQLLASNPAARRTLGATRKAKAKFVSPMIGAQE